MVRCTLKDPTGNEVVSFDYPTDLSELPITRFIDFLVECRELDGDPVTSMAVMVKAVGAFTGVSLTELLQVKAGVFSVGQEAYEGSISQLFGKAVKMIADFKPQLMTPNNCQFEYQGETYFIPVILQQAIAGENTLPDLNVIEVIEVAEVNRFKNQVTSIRGDGDGKLRKKINDLVALQIKENGGSDSAGEITKAGEKIYKNEVERIGDPDGSLMLTYYLKTLAVLARKKNESMPFEDSVREGWIQDRAFHFQKIDAATALSVDFFLTSILPYSEQRPDAVGFLKSQCFAAVAGMSLKKGKPLRKGSPTVRKSSKK